ncbi:nuclease-related domain-containing protein [Mycoplasmopsis lipofaciens]|uniref:nuclease-related domain-containing protein n=1 Tax=Mycoplasmopsis lipofaciens TaxID=114884 RepID=UPI00055E974E|nr:nuclease-related domain-containing protein [Mycoplasmopsis lipofaciens]
MITKEMAIGISIGTIFTFTILTFLFAYTILKVKKEKNKNSIGFKFENKIKNKMLNIVKTNNYKYLNGGLFKYSETQWFEIDGILISEKAIFIIETKYYIGTLKGNALDTEITLINNKKRKKFRNPLIQNFKHIQHFYKMCRMSFPIFSLVILPSQTSQELEALESWSVVVNEDNIEQTLKEIDEDMKDDLPISNEIVRAIIDITNASRTSSYKDIKRFGKIIKKDINDK